MYLQIETSKRFMSLTSRPVLCPDKRSTQDCEHPEGCPQNRVDFYKTFSLLIRMGCKERQLTDRNCKRFVSIFYTQFFKNLLVHYVIM